MVNNLFRAFSFLFTSSRGLLCDFLPITTQRFFTASTTHTRSRTHLNRKDLIARASMHKQQPTFLLTGSYVVFSHIFKNVSCHPLAFLDIMQEIILHNRNTVNGSRILLTTFLRIFAKSNKAAAFHFYAGGLNYLHVLLIEIPEPNTNFGPSGERNSCSELTGSPQHVKLHIISGSGRGTGALPHGRTNRERRRGRKKFFLSKEKRKKERE